MQKGATWLVLSFHDILSSVQVQTHVRGLAAK